MEEQLETQRFKEGRRFFIYAPPLKGTRKSKRVPPNPPFISAPPFKTSVYYYWWEFLRRSDDYKRCCEKGGKGKLAKLYADFGNVFEERDTELDTFWNWWTAKHPVTGENRGQTLFAEPPARRLTERVSSTTPSEDTLVIEVPLELRTAYLINQFRQLLSDYDKRAKSAQAVSRAMYPVETKPVLSALHTALTVYDAIEKNKRDTNKKVLWQLFDEVSQKLDYFNVDDTHTIVFQQGRKIIETKYSLRRMERIVAQKPDSDEAIFISEVREVVRRRKANAVKRQERIARQYIRGVEIGKFPLKTHR